MSDNTITVFYYDYATSEWIEINGQNGRLAFPLTYGNMLDERLDELRLVIIGSPQKSFKPTTPFVVFMGSLLGDDVNAVYRTFTLGIDNAVETPIGSGLYRHEITLLEPTKLLEGIPCQTITFTNENGTMSSTPLESPITLSEYTNAFDTVWGFDPVVKAIENNFTSGQYSPNASQYIRLLSPEEMAMKLYPYIKTNSSNGIRVFNYYDSSLYDQDNGLAEIYYKKVTVNGYENSLSLKYIPLSKETTTIEYTIPFAFVTNIEPNSARYVAQFSFTVIKSSEKSPTLPYTVTSMTMRCLELAEPITAGSGGSLGIPRIEFEGAAYNFELVDEGVSLEADSQAEKYNNVIADELTLTQASLREQLNTIGHLIHSQIRAYYKVNAWISKNESFGIRGEPSLVVRYDEYGSTTEAVFPDKTSNVFYRSVSHSINEYCTALRSNASNIVNVFRYGDSSISDPFSSGAGFKTLRTDNTNVRIEDGNGLITTQEAIYKISKVIAGVIVDDGDNYAWEKSGGVEARADITDRVLERAEYELKSAFDSTGKCMFIYYTQGEPNIDGLFFKRAQTEISSVADDYAIIKILKQKLGSSFYTLLSASDIYSRLVFQVSYVPVYSAILSHGKQFYDPHEIPYEQFYNQTENVIESRYFGENIKGAAARMGNVQQEATFISVVESFNELPRAGSMYKGHSIAAVNSLIYPNFVKYTLALSKDYQRINEYVGISSHKRVYEISEREAFKRNILLKQKILVSTQTTKSDSNAFAKTVNFCRALAQANEDKSTPAHFITGVIAKSYDKIGEPIGNYKILPVVSSAFGNSLSFSWKYKDNYSAGLRSSYHSETTTSNNEVSGYWSEDVPYSDSFGRNYKYLFSLFNLLGYAGENGLYGYEDISNIGDLPYSFPEADTPPDSSTISGVYLMRKDSREAINNVTLQMEYVTDNPNIIIGSGFPYSCDLVMRDAGAFGSARLCALGKKLNKFDTTVDESSIIWETQAGDIFDFTYDVINDNNVSVTIHLDTNHPIANAAGWCFALPRKSETKAFEDGGEQKVITITNGGNILFGGNFSPDFPSANFSGTTFYFTIQK